MKYLKLFEYNIIDDDIIKQFKEFFEELTDEGFTITYLRKNYRDFVYDFERGTKKYGKQINSYKENYPMLYVTISKNHRDFIVDENFINSILFVESYAAFEFRLMLDVIIEGAYYLLDPNDIAKGIHNREIKLQFSYSTNYYVK